MAMICEVSAALFANGQIGVSRAPATAEEKAYMAAALAAALQQVLACSVPAAAASGLVVAGAPLPPMDGRN